MDYQSEILNNLRTSHPNAGCELNYNTTFELLVAVILSAQCTDKRVNMATAELFKICNTPTALASLELEELKPYIYSLGFFNNKAKNLISMAKDIVKKYDGQVPTDFDALTSLSGVGRKTASVVLSVGFDIPAMPVDTHVFRVSRRIGLSDGNTPEKVEQDLMNQFKKEDWNSLHHTMIFHGRYVCHAKKPNCGECLLRENCQYYKGNNKGE